MKKWLLLTALISSLCLGACSRAEWNLPKVDPNKEKQAAPATSEKMQGGPPSSPSER